MLFNVKKLHALYVFLLGLSKKQVLKGELGSMNFTMELIGFKDEIFTKMEKISDATVIYIELPKKKHICPSCSKAIRILKNG